MLLGGPLMLGIIVGIVIILPTIWFKKKTHSKILIFAPSIISLIVAIYIFYLGYVVIRGFEGGAHMILAFLILVVSCISFYIAMKAVQNN